MQKIKIVLIGNTNAGKTTFLNTIGGLSQTTSNYPGTTVEIFVAKIKNQNVQYEIVDLPGIYSLAAFSLEEKVTSKILQTGKFDLVVQLIEPAAQKRSLTLTLELMELGVPLFLVLNNKQGIWQQANCLLKKVEQKLGITGIVIDARQPATKAKFFAALTRDKLSPPKCSALLSTVHESLQPEIKKLQLKLKRANFWEVLKVLENNQAILRKYPAAKPLAENFALKDEDYGLAIKNNRYFFLEKYFRKFFARPKTQTQGRRACTYRGKCPYFMTDRIDNILLNRWLGIPLFLLLLFLIFETTFTLGALPMNFIESTFSLLQAKLTLILPQNLWTAAFIEGILGGVGAVLVFLPPIMLLFFFFALLQQSGYLARTAYLLDHLVQKIGLSGKSFVPLLMGFGCNVPAIMATRTLVSRKEKIITAMMIPFMSCGAKLPVYTLLIAAFFAPQYQGIVLFGLYCFGILVALLTGILVHKFRQTGKPPLLLELPAYTLPRLRDVWLAIIEPAKAFLLKAGKVILPLTLIFWALFSFPQIEELETDLEQSYAAQLGTAIEPIFAPLGFDWRISLGLIAGLGAKEALISTFGTLYSVAAEGSNGLILKLQNDPIFTPLTALTLLIFVLLYTPCLAVIAVFRQEFGNKWAVFGFLYPTLLAWGCAFLVFRIGQLLGY